MQRHLLLGLSALLACVIGCSQSGPPQADPNTDPVTQEIHDRAKQLPKGVEATSSDIDAAIEQAKTGKKAE